MIMKKGNEIEEWIRNHGTCPPKSGLIDTILKLIKSLGK